MKFLKISITAIVSSSPTRDLRKIKFKLVNIRIFTPFLLNSDNIVTELVVKIIVP
jgi:hypothetical protein